MSREQRQFLSRANNYKSAPGKFMKKEAFPKQDLKKRFHEHYYSDRHNDMENQVITYIDNVDTLKELRRKELSWMNKLKTYAPYGFNKRVVCEAF